MKGTAASHFILSHVEVLGAMILAGSRVSGGAGCPWVTGSSGGTLEALEAFRTRVRPNKKAPPRESVCQYVCKGRVRRGPISEDGKGQLKAWVTDLAEYVAKSCRSSELTRGVEPDDWIDKRA